MKKWIRVSDDVGFAIRLDPQAEDGISRAYRDGVYPAEYRALLDLVRIVVGPGGRILDLGAHIGSFALAAAAAGYEVAAVEASPRNLELLAESARLNEFARFKVIHAAVTDRRGTIAFCPAGPFGHVALPGSEGSGVVVEATTVGDLLADLGWHSVDFIKVDVEGSEVAALKGIDGAVPGGGRPLIFVECNGHTLDFFGRRPADLKAELERSGYRVYAVIDDRFVRVRPADFEPATVIDYLAIPQTSPPPQIAAKLVAGGRTTDEIIAGTLASAAAPNPAERAYIARALGDAPASLLGIASIRAAVLALQGDGDPAVRLAAGRIAD